MENSSTACDVEFLSVINNNNNNNNYYYYYYFSSVLSTNMLMSSSDTTTKTLFDLRVKNIFTLSLKTVEYLLGDIIIYIIC